MLVPTRAFKKPRGLWSDSGPGSIGLWAYVVRAQHQARAHGLGPRPVPALAWTVSVTGNISYQLSSSDLDRVVKMIFRAWRVACYESSLHQAREKSLNKCYLLASLSLAKGWRALSRFKLGKYQMFGLFTAGFTSGPGLRARSGTHSSSIKLLLARFYDELSSFQVWKNDDDTSSQSSVFHYLRDIFLNGLLSE